MSKIIQAVNSMISNADSISQVTYGCQGKEIFFSYKNQYKWSIKLIDDGSYSLWFYKTNKSIENLSNIFDEEWEEIPMMHYSTKELATKEAFASFEELYRVVKEKMLGMDTVLDDIIKDMDDLPF